MQVHTCILVVENSVLGIYSPAILASRGRSLPFWPKSGHSVSPLSEKGWNNKIYLTEGVGVPGERKIRRPVSPEKMSRRGLASGAGWVPPYSEAQGVSREFLFSIFVPGSALSFCFSFLFFFEFYLFESESMQD